MSILYKSEIFSTVKDGVVLPPKGLVLDLEVNNAIHSGTGDGLWLFVTGLTYDGESQSLYSGLDESERLTTGLNKVQFTMFAGETVGYYFSISDVANETNFLDVINSVIVINESPVQCQMMTPTTDDSWSGSVEFETPKINTISKGKRIVPEAMTFYYTSGYEDGDNIPKFRVKGKSNGATVTLLANHNIKEGSGDRWAETVEFVEKVPIESLWIEATNISGIMRINRIELLSSRQDNLETLETTVLQSFGAGFGDDFS